MRDFFNKDLPIRFVFPIDGDCLNKFDKQALVAAPEGHDVEICGQKASYVDGLYRAPLTECDVMTATDKTDGTECKIQVFRLKNAVGGYRLSSDDNIIFLQDITKHKDEYTSIFDNSYLAVYKKAHDLYGAKVHLNLFYEFDDEARSRFSEPREYFNLSMMTDKFKDEFKANSDWLKFSFHSKSEFPPMPYKFASAKTVREDALKVHREIERFAGKEVLSECTTVHFGEANYEVACELRKLGYKAMTGYFISGEFPVAYYAPQELIEYVYNRDFWKDTESDILFGRIDIVLNGKTHVKNLETLEEITSSETRGGFVSIMIHEQYFYSDYINYREDFETRVVDACRFLKEKGYEGRHICRAADI